MRHIKVFELFTQDLQNHRESMPTYDIDKIELKYTQRGDSTGGFYKIKDLDDNSLGGFNVKEVGDIEIDADGHFTDEEILDTFGKIDVVFPNSALFAGGFIVNYDKHKLGIGKAAIRKYLLDNTNIENIFLYAVPWQGSIPFWHKMGGESILKVENDKKAIHFIQLKRENILNT